MTHHLSLHPGLVPHGSGLIDILIHEVGLRVRSLHTGLTVRPPKGQSPAWATAFTHSPAPRLLDQWLPHWIQAPLQPCPSPLAPSHTPLLETPTCFLTGDLSSSPASGLSFCE